MALPAQGDRTWLSPGVGGVAAASFFSDSGHEIATSLLPSFLTSVLHAGPGALGMVEGTSDALIGLSKLAGGPLASNPDRRGRLAAGGYLGTAIATAAIGLATAVWQVAILRAFAWVSRGIRSPARDTLLVSLVPRAAYGRASGLERAGDNAGALLGPLLAALLVGVIGIRATIGLAIVPGMLAAASITIAARQARRTLATPTARTTLSLNLREMRQAGIVRALAPAAAFELGNLAATLLILRATDLLQTGEGTVTTATRIAILRYAGHNAVAALTAVAAGTLTDRIGSRRVFAVGPHPWPWLLAGFALAGLGIGLAETAQSATVALLLPDRLRGTGFGALGLVQAFGDLGTSVVAGLLWAAVSPTLAFGYAAAWMTLSLLASLLVPRTIPAPEAAPAGARPGQVRTKVPDHEQQPRASIEP